MVFIHHYPLNSETLFYCWQMHIGNYSQVVVIDRTLGSAELRLNFLAMPSQFGFWQRTAELCKFCITHFCNFLKKIMFFPLYLWIFPSIIFFRKSGCKLNLFFWKSGCKLNFFLQMCVLWLIPNDKTRFISYINAKKWQSLVQFCSFWQRMAEKFGSVGFWQCSSSVDH